MTVGPSKTQISLGIRPVWSVFAVREMGSSRPNVSSRGQRWLWSDWADAQADPSLFADQTGRIFRLIWVFICRLVVFIMRRLILASNIKYSKTFVNANRTLVNHTAVNKRYRFHNIRDATTSPYCPLFICSEDLVAQMSKEITVKANMSRTVTKQTYAPSEDRSA